MSYFDPDLVPVYCVACGGWDQSAGGSGHKLGCHKGAHRTRISAPPSPYWIMIGRWSTHTLSDSWEVRRIVESIRSHSGIEIIDYLVKGSDLGIIVTNPVLGNEPKSYFAQCSWYTVIELQKAEATKDRLMKEFRC